MVDQVPATISVPEAASLLGISRGSAYEAARSGGIPALRVGHRLLVPLASLARELEISPEAAWALIHEEGDSGTEPPIKHPPHKRETNGADNGNNS